MNSLLRRGLGVLTFVVSTTLCRAEFVSPEEIPVERVLKIAEAELARNLDSAEAHYTVARIHYLAFSQADGKVPAYMPSGSREELSIPRKYLTDLWLRSARFQEGRRLALAELGLKEVPKDLSQRRALDLASYRHMAKLDKENWRPSTTMEVGARGRHAVAALQEFEVAIRMRPEPLHLLGLASLQEEVADWKSAVAAATLPRELALVSHAQAQETYLKAFRSAYPKEATFKDRGIEGLVGLVSYEAGVGYLRLSERNRGVVRTDGAIRDEITASIEKLRQLPQGAITPIIFTIEPARSIESLLASERRVNFNLRGYGPAERWPWLQPTTALLVWDPAGRGEIVSGRQLFGGYTFQIFRETGYDALAALDDDGSGELNGAELTGLRAWFDRNGDGRSDPAEVCDLAELGIVGIDVRATGKDGIHPTNPVGLRLRDGGTLPTWDWIVAPVAGPN